MTRILALAALLLAGCASQQPVPVYAPETVARGISQAYYATTGGPNFGALCGPEIFVLPPLMLACFK